MLRIYLDFDGVIAHSAIECISSAFNVWSAMHSDLLDKKILTDLDCKNSIIEISVANRSLVIPPEHYFCLIQSVYEQIKSLSPNTSQASIEQNFNKNCKSASHILLDQFKRNFFEYREQKFHTQSDAGWVQENPATFFTKELFKMIKSFDVEIFIVSRKNYMSLDKWVSGSGYKVDGIFGNEELAKFENSKFKLISNLQTEKSPRKSIFVDDTAFEFNSSGWSDINVVTLEAGWGYNNLSDNTNEILKKINGNLNDLYN